MTHLAYARKKEQRWAVGDTSVFSNITPYGVLFTTVPKDDGSAYAEPSGANGYARLAISGKFGSPPVPASDGSLANTALVAWATATGPWGDIVAWGIADSSTIGAGNIIRVILLAEKKTVSTSDVFEFNIGDAILR